MKLGTKTLFLSLLLLSGISAWAGSLDVSPNYRKITKEFDSGTTSFSVQLTNTSSQLKTFIIQSDTSWVSTSKSSVSLAAGQSTTVRITVNASAGQAPGTHFGFVSFGEGPLGILAGALTVELKITLPDRPPIDRIN